MRGCTEAFEFSTLTTELRWLAEREAVDVIVAASNGPDEVIVREVARRYPRGVFVAVAHGPREVTLRRPARNLVRFAADHGQGVAGLADPAYHGLGWRRVAVVAGNWDAGWSARDAFTAEFCALGGRVAAQLGVDVLDPAGNDVARVPRDVDGVAVFAPGFFGPAARAAGRGSVAADRGRARARRRPGAAARHAARARRRRRQLERGARAAAQLPAGVRAVRSIPGVDQSLGGLLEPSAAPGDRPAACSRGRRPPAWAG